jgi:hypothetical protein
MPVTIPAGTKFEAIKPTTNVNRRSALVNANDPVFTIEDIAQTVGGGGGGFTITNNYIPRGDASGSIVDSNLYQGDQGYGTTLEGQFVGGINILTQPFTNLFTVVNDTVSGFNFVALGDNSGTLGPLWGFIIDSNPFSPTVSISTNGNNVLYFFPSSGQYEIGGSTSRFGMVNGDTPQSAMYFTPDLVTNVGGTDYIKVIINGTAYKIELVP